MLSKRNFSQVCAGLKRLGYSNYKDYLNGPEWASTKLRASSTNTGRKNKCFICGSYGVAWHHRIYKRLGKERIGLDIVRVCQAHHDDIHKLNSLGVWKASKKVSKLYKNHQI